MSENSCPFCKFVLAGTDRPLLFETENIVAFEDAYPSTPGHTLVIPRRHIGRISDLTEAEYSDLWIVAKKQIQRLEKSSPDAYTIGVNDGEAAGQTIAHVHLHVIPRRLGDTAEVKGGIRWAVRETAAYWELLKERD